MATLEDAWQEAFDAGQQLTDVLLSWAAEHEAELRADAARGCPKTVALLHAIHTYLTAAEAAGTVEYFGRVVAGLDGLGDHLPGLYPEPDDT